MFKLGASRAIRASVALVVAAMALLAPGAGVASASELVDRDTTSPRMRINARGVALVEYKAHGRQWHVLYWGGLNRTLRFRHHDRSGGWKSKKAHWKTFTDVCGPYAGPELQYLIDACTMPDGTHWALQEWMRSTPNYGGKTGPRDLRLSHFTGATAYLWIAADWSHNGHYQHLYGQYIYQNKPVYGKSWTSTGYVLDKMGRNVAIDSWNSDWGLGWRRVNAFLSNYPNGQFCFGFTQKIPTDTRNGASPSGWYRASVVGPGVSPDIMTYFRGQLVPYDKKIDAIHNYWQSALAAGSDMPCSKPN